MKINQKIIEKDPSRAVVYEMMEYIKKDSGLILNYQETDNLFLFKTVPYANNLYNYAHVFGDKLREEDWKIIEQFFAGESFRVKMLEDKTSEELLMSKGLKYKSCDCSMETADISQIDFNLNLPKDCKIVLSSEPGALQDMKNIFCDAFNHVLKDYDDKFGFFDHLMLDNNKPKINGFVLYKNGRAVSSGTYYAFSNFSLENIGTLESERGQGYGKIIITYLLNRAKELNYKKACLVSYFGALEVYKKLGFKENTKEVTYIKY